MGWDTRLNPVRRALSLAINEQRIIRDIATQSGLSMEFVGDRPDAASYWTTVLERALDEGDRRVDAVLNEALERTDNQMAHDAVETYRNERGGQ